MAKQVVDPGYGDPGAPVGSAEWAKRWRLVMQTAVKRLPETTKHVHELYVVGEQHRAWTLVTDDRNPPRAFRDFDAFCAYPQPYGLGTDPNAFRAHLVAEVGERAADLITAPQDGRADNGATQGRAEDGTFRTKGAESTDCSDDRTNRMHDKGGRPRKDEKTGDTVPPVFEADTGSGRKSGHDKAARLRAILRAPESIQQLYRDGLVSQTAAAMLGPQKPDAEQAAAVVRAREAVEAIPAPPAGDATARRDYRRKVDQAIRETMGRPGPTPLDLLHRAWARASETERVAFLAEVNAASLKE